ncbi:MAG: adenosylmethionine--8-amino-7-oxononanoate transaminase [Gammaproteobacteria bacterium]|nr:adenosylmethionine--8-amino-7-oxononanoate transaminase [Gammaproteobacteria bacterium]
MNDTQKMQELDARHVWHPYSATDSNLPVYPVVSAHGVRLKLADGRELLDGMASWWCVIHGYNHPRLNQAITDQLQDMAHVMFGGLTHPKAVALATKLVDITPATLQSVFFSDSGSVSVEVAMKMAIQYWHAKGKPHKQHFASLRHGYHGDTFAAMSVCDPITGMHSLFADSLSQQFFIDAPPAGFDRPCSDADMHSLQQTLQQHGEQIAALILEPVVQGAGGMRFYAPDYLRRARELCNEYHVLLIADEIATGFGRTGKLFACEHADISPDIMCVGKSLTGGYLTLAATLTTSEISHTISNGDPGIFMHGPTFMANPLACAVSLASIELLLETDWQENIQRISRALEQGLAPCRELDTVQQVRILGAIGVVEMKQSVDMKRMVPMFVEAGIWIRPFGKLVYLMPPFVMSDKDIDTLTSAVHSVLQIYSH